VSSIAAFFDAVQSLVAKVLKAGGRIVHGGQPRITSAIANQANNWNVLDEHEPPILIYQSEYFRTKPAPPGHDEMQRAGFATVRWTPVELGAVADRFKVDPEQFLSWLPEQAASTSDEALREALLAMRLQMLLESQPTAAVSIGGMEGIQAEAKLYLSLAEMRLIPWADRVNVIGSTYGAASKLESAGINIADYHQGQDDALLRPPTGRDLDDNSPGSPRRFSFFESGSKKDDLPPTTLFKGTSKETARQDIQTRLSYDDVMFNLVKDVTKQT